MRWKRAPPHFFHLGGRRCNSRWLWGDLAADFHRIHSLTIHYPVPVLTNLSTRKKISQFRQIYLYQNHIDPVQTKNPSPWQSSSDKFTFIRPTSIQSQQNIRHPDNPVLTNLLFYQTQNLGFSFVTDSLIIVYIILEGWISQYLPSDFVLKLASQKAPPPPPEAKPSHQSSNRGLCEYNGKRKSTYSLIRSLQPQFLHCLSAWMQSIWTTLSAPSVFIACLGRHGISH